MHAKSECETALVLAKQPEQGPNTHTHPIYPLILRIAAYFVDDVSSRLDYLIKATQCFRSTPPSSLAFYTLPFAETLSSLGRYYLKQHQPQLAVKVLEEAEGMFGGMESAPPEDLIICFIRLGRAFQASGRLSEADEVLDKAHNALRSANLRDKASLTNQLVRVREKRYNVPSSVSTSSDPIAILSSVYQVEINVVDSGMSISYSMSSYWAASET